MITIYSPPFQPAPPRPAPHLTFVTCYIGTANLSIHPVHSLHSQAKHSELIRKQEDQMDKDLLRSYQSSFSSRPTRVRRSRSRSPTRQLYTGRKRSRSPKPEKLTFRMTTQGYNHQDKLSTCPICLGRHRHHVASCQATSMWNGNEAIST